MTIETGGPAFPCEGGNKFISGNEIRRTIPSSGMDLRDYFAAKAMQAILPTCDGHSFGPEPGNSNDRLAKCAYAVADAMLAARTK